MSKAYSHRITGGDIADIAFISVIGIGLIAFAIVAILGVFVW